MKSSNARQVILMMIAWALALIVYDRLFNKHLFAPTAAAMEEFTKPQIRMWVNHLCCSGCVDSTFAGVRSLQWLTRPQIVAREKLLTQEQANLSRDRSSYGGAVVFDVLDISKVEFVTLYESLRQKGMVVGSTEFGGLPHYSLKVGIDRHLCCRLCVKAVEEALVPKQDPKYGSTLRWLDGAQVSQVAKTVTAFVKIGYASDISELIATLENAGFPAEYIRVQMEMKQDMVYPPN